MNADLARLRPAGQRCGVKTSLTGIKPTGLPHIGNYLGAIKPALELAATYRSLYFIADYHAFTSEHDPKKLNAEVYDVAATWLACGLNPKTTLLYRQSHIPEVFELAWIFECLIAAGQLERGHAYKDAVARGESPNAGLFNYPALMAADIVLFDCDIVPVGKDQKQHIELARDVAVRVNHLFGDGTVVVPTAKYEERLLVPGIDGRKMSKSYNNSIPVFASAKDLRGGIMKIVTGSEGLDDPKEADGSTVYQMFCAIASPSDAAQMAASLKKGGYGWGHAKQALYEALEAEVGPKRAAFEALRRDEAALDVILEDGASRAREIARATMMRVRKAIGIAR